MYATYGSFLLFLNDSLMYKPFKWKLYRTLTFTWFCFLPCSIFLKKFWDFFSQFERRLWKFHITAKMFEKTATLFRGEGRKLWCMQLYCVQISYSLVIKCLCSLLLSLNNYELDLTSVAHLSSWLKRILLRWIMCL